jgi:hypothetical protein
MLIKEKPQDISLEKEEVSPPPPPEVRREASLLDYPVTGGGRVSYWRNLRLQSVLLHCSNTLGSTTCTIHTWYVDT